MVEKLNTQVYPSAREVSDFHRNSDVDLRTESQHHTLGTSSYQASAGDHIHDGSTGVPLLGDVLIQGDYNTVAGRQQIIDNIVKALSEHLGAQDLTLNSPS